MGARRTAGALLPYANLLLMMYAGAALMTAARLRWDVTLYAAARAALGAGGARAAGGALALGGAALGALAALAAAAAQRPRQARYHMLRLYAALMALMVACEALAAWRLWAWARRALQASEGAAEALAHLRALLRDLERWGDLPGRLNALIDEALEQLPLNARVAGGAVAALVALQLAAVALALLAAGARRSAPKGHRHHLPLPLPLLPAHPGPMTRPLKLSSSRRPRPPAPGVC